MSNDMGIACRSEDLVGAYQRADIDPASFRDPSGFVFRDSEGRLCRQVNECYLPSYRMLMESGLYQDLTDAGLLVAHTLADGTAGPGIVLHPTEIPFVSYPYEWSFHMLKDAALLTLQIQRRALARGMSLKDASAYNVQFEGTRPVFIDTLSFEPLKPGAPWVAYGQFCRHFLAPLALMSWTDVRLRLMLAQFIDGVPLDLAAQLLPWRAVARPGILMHLWLHARSVRRHQATGPAAPKTARAVTLSVPSLERLIVHLEQTIQKLRWRPPATGWIDYYQDNSYTEAMRDAKVRWVSAALQRLRPRTVLDLGANTGLFSRLAREAGALAIAIEGDPACVDRLYLEASARQDTRLLPLCMDLTNPSPALGWANRERRSLIERGPADVVLALALVHHLAVSNNVPLARIADWLRQLGRQGVVEFVPKSDPQTQRLLQSREDVFADYTQPAFEAALSNHFRITERQAVGESGRMLYLLEERG